MPRAQRDSHGNFPDTSPVVLLLVDVINDLAFPGNAELVRNVPRLAAALSRLKARAEEAGIAVVYVNDNFGRWRSDFASQVRHVLREGSPGRTLAARLTPGRDDAYFVLKPKHSGFFASALDTLLHQLGARTLIVTGIAGDRCVLFTASDAFLRDYELYVPRDCTLSNRAADNRAALLLMERVLRADTRKSTGLDLRALVRRARRDSLREQRRRTPGTRASSRS